MADEPLVDRLDRTIDDLLARGDATSERRVVPAACIATAFGASFVPEGRRTITPFAHARGVPDYIEFLQRASTQKSRLAPSTWASSCTPG